MLTNVLFKFAPSSTHSNGNIISGTFFITSISANGIKSMLICNLLAADNGVPDICKKLLIYTVQIACRKTAFVYMLFKKKIKSLGK